MSLWKDFGMSERIHPVILCGGSGTRLWPMSRRALPKQFLPLVSERSMLQDTLLRLLGLDFAPPIVVSNNEHRFLVAEQLREIDIELGAQILEPVGRNTAPAAAVAALSVQEKDPAGVLLVLPADHLIRDVYRFHDAVRRAARLASSGTLVTFGITPDQPATGYGYIERGDAIDAEGGAFRVARFVEKPERARAEEFLASGRFSWNSGMFAFAAGRLLEEIGKHRADILAASRTAWEKAKRDLDFLRLDERAFAACPAESIDYAVMEKTDAAAVIPVDIGWSDVGSWSTLWEVGEKDGRGNVVRGDVHLRDAENCYVRAESRMVSVLGVKNAIVVETDDALLVADQSQVQKVKDIVGHLDGAHRTEHLTHTRVYRPWGYYESIDAGNRFQVKRIMVKPGAALSLQMHHHRAEHWIAVSGTARVTRGDEVVLLAENQSTYIPIGTRHRLENPGKVPLFLIEVQSGGYLGEDDIVRFEDLYKRD
jgi:mannose-1-phosphate guanylyltransferase/mannose-6-phosphate isomerase